VANERMFGVLGISNCNLWTGIVVNVNVRAVIITKGSITMGCKDSLSVFKLEKAAPPLVRIREKDFMHEDSSQEYSNQYF
jgi:hypothetical protein